MPQQELRKWRLAHIWWALFFPRQVLLCWGRWKIGKGSRGKFSLVRSSGVAVYSSRSVWMCVFSLSVRSSSQAPLTLSEADSLKTKEFLWSGLKPQVCVCVQTFVSALAVHSFGLFLLRYRQQLVEHLCVLMDEYEAGYVFQCVWGAVAECVSAKSH